MIKASDKTLRSCSYGHEFKPRHDLIAGDWYYVLKLTTKSNRKMVWAMYLKSAHINLAHIIS